jgi:hypothetical protein
LRKTIFILNFISSALIFAQNPESSTPLYEKEYYDLINYVPQNLEFDSIHKPENRGLQVELNTISSIRIYSGIREYLNLNKNDNQWIDNRINQIATALFLDGKRILASAVGGYSGCPDKMIDTLRLNNIKITDLKFCHSCTDADQDQNFIRIFNARMYSLMKIEPPNRKTESFYGEYKGSDKYKFKMKLVLLEDRTFKFWLNKGHGSDFTEGFWKNKNDTLILKSRAFNKTNDINFTLSSAKWIDFNELEFQLKRGKLTEFSGGNRKLKKRVE